MLASWNQGAAKSTILDFVARVTEEGGRDYAFRPPSASRPEDDPFPRPISRLTFVPTFRSSRRWWPVE
jgi:hypothetical protein